MPYAEKDEAKALGARWDPAAKRWFDPRPPTARLQRWAALPDVPDLLPGEDRGFGAGLFVDLVPRSCWFTNVRTCVSQRDWERLRRMILRRAGHACEACGATEDRETRRWLEAHERWSYDERTGVQSLRRLICLCSPCHLVTHFGYANVTGRTEEAFAHLRAVTGMSQAQAWEHVRAAEDRWIARSGRTWELDLSILIDAGITLARPERGADRPAAAARTLRREQNRYPDPHPPQRTSANEQVASPRPSRSAPRQASPPPMRQHRARPAETAMPPDRPAERHSFWARITGRLRSPHQPARPVRVRRRC